MMLLALLACNDNDLSAIKLDAIAVVLGDFDNLTEPLTSLEIATQPYDGFIVQATYEPEDDRTLRGDMATTVEGLLTSTNSKGQLDLFSYNAAFVNSGTRGLGAGAYNNSLEPDDSLLADTDAMDNACEFASGGGTLLVTDWAYELVEYCWPDALEFFGDDAAPDAAQVGVADGSVLADVKDEVLVAALGEAMSLTFEYTAWAVIESVGAETEVLVSGDIPYQPASDELFEELQDAPLMVRLKPGRGQVVYTTFHIASQTHEIAETLLVESIEGLDSVVGSDPQGAGSE